MLIGILTLIAAGLFGLVRTASAEACEPEFIDVQVGTVDTYQLYLVVTHPISGAVINKVAVGIPFVHSTPPVAAAGFVYEVVGTTPIFEAQPNPAYDPECGQIEPEVTPTPVVTPPVFAPTFLICFNGQGVYVNEWAMNDHFYPGFTVGACPEVVVEEPVAEPVDEPAPELGVTVTFGTFCENGSIVTYTYHDGVTVHTKVAGSCAAVPTPAKAGHGPS
jgi:hypothetical protein